MTFTQKQIDAIIKEKTTVKTEDRLMDVYLKKVPRDTGEVFL